MTKDGIYWWRAFGQMFICGTSIDNPNVGWQRYWMHKMARMIVPCDPNWWLYYTPRACNDNDDVVV